MKNKIFVLIVTLLMCLTSIVIIHSDLEVEATIGGGEGILENETGLDYDFMWSVVKNLSDVVYTAYNEGEIRKGRDFGSKGEFWTADYLWRELNNLSLNDVHYEPLTNITNKEDWHYNYNIKALDFELTINGNNYPYPHTISTSEIFAAASALPEVISLIPPFKYTMNYNQSFGNIKIIPKNLSQWPLIGKERLADNYIKNVSATELNNFNMIIGNTTYVPVSDSLPEDQYGRLFLLDEESGCEDQLNNITNATGAVLMHDNTKGYYANYNFSNSTIQYARVNKNDNNLTMILEMIENHTIIFADNYFDTDTIVFTYNLSCFDWPNQNFFALTYNINLGVMTVNTGAIWALNLIYQYINPLRICLGAIMYDDYAETHLMFPVTKNWIGWNPYDNLTLIVPSNGIQIFSVNNSIGTWLEQNYNNPDVSASGYFEQAEAWEDDSKDVIGYINTTQSPNNSIVVISDRYDGYWGEAPGDAGAGHGIALGIAKFMKDHNIKPKYNLTFLFTTGEEYGMRGAYHYSDKHPYPDYNIIQFIGFEQAGLIQNDTYLLSRVNNETIKNITWAIVNDSHYTSETGYGYENETVTKYDNFTTDCAAFRQRQNCNTLTFFKDGNPWTGHHRSGMNYQEGDSLKYIDRDDMNFTFNISWDIVKYFTVNPDSWFSSYTFTPYDSPDDEDSLPDSIRANFTMKTIMPQDLVMVRAYLRKSTGENATQTSMNFTINSTGQQATTSLTLPPNGTAGYYELYLELYNSTGRINEIVNISGYNVNNTKPSPQQFTNIYPYKPPSPPEITNVSASPNIVGFGYNVTITANVTDEGSGVNTVKVNITGPQACGWGASTNYTMTNIGGDTYQYIFNDTWQTGKYNYTIWASDNYGNNNTTSAYSFNVSANATVHVYTLKDNYTTSEYVNITDPPMDYQLIDRGLTWDKYYNPNTGTNTLEVSAEPINYQDENGLWIPIDTTIENLQNSNPASGQGYQMGGEQGLFGVYFKNNAQDDWPVAFAYNKSLDNMVRSKPVGIGYLDPSNGWSYKHLESAQSSQAQIDGNNVKYDNILAGTDITYTYSNTELKEKITLDEITKTMLINNPPSSFGLSNQDSYLVFVTKLDCSGLGLYDNDDVQQTGNFTISESGIALRDAQNIFRCAIPLGEAYESNDETIRQPLTYRIIQYNNNCYLLSGLKTTDLMDMNFPVVIDPTLTIISSTSDGYIYNHNGTYTNAWNAPSGTVSSLSDTIYVGQHYHIFSDYYIYRGYLFFNTTSIPVDAMINSMVLSLYKKTDNSTTDFDIVVQNGQPYYPHDPLLATDYNKSFYSGNGGSISTSVLVNGYNNISLNNPSWLNRKGFTKLCLRSSRDINCTSPILGADEFVTIYSSDYQGGAGHAPRLIVMYGNQSKIKNTGSTDIKGYLLMQVQYHNSTWPSGVWVVADDTINETTTRTITSGNLLALDTIFNNKVYTTNLIKSYGTGLYRVYAAFRDPHGDVLQCDNGVLLEANHEFTIT